MATHTSLSFGIASTTTQATTPPDSLNESLTTSEGLAISVEIGSETDADGGSGVSATALGSATAVGTDTLAMGELVATATLGTAYDMAHAEASFIAVGSDDTGNQALAIAEAYAEVSGSFDIVITKSSYQEAIATSGDTSLWLEAQSASVTAIDIGGSLSSGSETASTASPDMSGQDIESTRDEPLFFEETGTSSEDTPLNVELMSADTETGLSGNTAFITFSAEATGPDTLADAAISAFTLEDQLSTVDGIAIAAASP